MSPAVMSPAVMSAAAGVPMREICPVALPSEATAALDDLSGMALTLLAFGFFAALAIGTLLILVGKAINSRPLATAGVVAIFVTVVVAIIFVTVPGWVTSMLGGMCMELPGSGTPPGQDAGAGGAAAAGWGFGAGLLLRRGGARRRPAPEWSPRKVTWVLRSVVAVAVLVVGGSVFAVTRGGDPAAAVDPAVGLAGAGAGGEDTAARRDRLAGRADAGPGTAGGATARVEPGPAAGDGAAGGVRHR